VPDFYQGTELWDVSLVDPDNRRPVDWAHRRRLLGALDGLLASATAGTGPASAPAVERAVAELLASWPDGRVKLFVTALGLRWRRAHPSVFADGDYIPLATSGPRADHVVAFARRAGSGVLVAVVPRLTMSLAAPGGWPIGEAAWGDTAIGLPHTIATHPLHTLLVGGRRVTVSPDGTVASLLVRDVLDLLPVALLSGAGPLG
jgi:(1->4)-alpha-D-glucan 1-alpha-D-glucosylmutase